jgi:cytochrome c peroxidase
MTALVRSLAACFIALVLAAPVAAQVILTDENITSALLHGPWPPPALRDPSNRVSGVPKAIELGAALFHDTALSQDGTMSCATCHDPDRDFADGLPHGQGRALLDRNTPSLWNLGAHRWFGWSGGTDNLWAQSLSPILNPLEMAHDLTSLHRALMLSRHCDTYDQLFGAMQGHDDQTVAVNVSKALAAYQETLVTEPSQFDLFRTALQRGDMAAAATYPQEAQRGLKIFLGEGRCSVCHLGPAFTNGEFHDAGVPYFLSETRVDQGRFAGLTMLFESPYTLDGQFNDDPEKTGAWAVRSVQRSPQDFGLFRVPGLRNVSQTAPYMHDGSLADLEAVVNHYNTIDLERMHADGEAILRPLGLTDADISDLVAFLESL